MRLKINEDIQHCWFGYYIDIKGNKKYFYMTKDSTSSDPDEASDIMEDSIPEPFTKFVFQGSVANTQAEKQGWKLVESSTCHKLSENYWIDNKEVMDELDRLGKELAGDGWNSYADKYTGKAYYWIFVKRENDKAVAKAIIYNHNIKPEVIDITIDQAIGKYSLDSNDALRRKLGSILLPQNESEADYIPVFGAKAKKDLNEFAYKIDDLKAFYNTSDSIDKNKFPNFFVWYDDMVKSGKLRTESMELNESGRYKGENKFGQNLSQEHLNELKNEPGKVFNFTKFDIFYGENKGHFPFKPCYYVTYRPSNYTSIFLDDEEILRYINANFKESYIKESYIELDDTSIVDELGYAGATEIKGNKVYADEETLRQLINELDFTPDIKMTMDEYSKSHAPKNESLSESIYIATIGDYITDHYDFDDIDDKYSCINSIRDSFKDEKTISKEELEQFIDAHNGKDKVNESKYQDISNVDLDNNLVKDLVARAFDYNQAQWLVDNDIEYAKHLAYDNVSEEEITEAEKYLASKGYAHQINESKSTHCVYFNQDGIEQVEFEGTEDECNAYIADIQAEQDDEFGDEAPERFIKKINEEIDDQDNRIEIIKESIDTANIEAIANANDSKVIYYNTWNELLKERDALCKSYITMLKGGLFVGVTYRQISADICWPFDECKADSLEKLFERYPRYRGLDVCIAKELLYKNTENINESPELIPIEIVDLENVDEQFSNDTVKELENYFKENDAAYILDELYYSKPRNVIEFDINNGDWKHEHLWAKRLIQEFFEKLDMNISIESFETQTDGSDCYSAHYTIYPGIKKSYTADIKESAIEEDYTPDILDDLVNHYAGRTDFATIWDEITNKFNDEDLANDVIEALELQASDLWEKYLTESKELSTDHAIVSVVDQVKAVYEAGLFDKLPVGRDRALTLDIFGPDKDRLVGYFKKQPEFNYEMNNENRIISHEFISDNYDVEVFDSFIQMYKIPQNESIAPDGYEPKKKGKAYKVFKVKNGKLYPPMVANPGGEDTPIGVWLTADEGEFAGISKTGRPQVKSTGSGTLSYRPGWHLGDIPRASQFDRTNKETGEKEFPKDFVWAECEYTMDVDYQPESDEQGYMRTDKNGNQYRSDKYQHSLAGLPKLPKDGYYKYMTNPRPDTVPWVITGAIKVNKLLSDDEVNEILAKRGIEPIHRQGGDKTLAELGL